MKQHKALSELLRKYNLELEAGRTHHRVVTRQGKYITSVSSSPSDPHFGNQTVRTLVRMGALPAEAKKVKI